MTYQTADVSIQDGNPIELYNFRGDDANFYFTNASETYTFGVTDYVPVKVARTQPRVNQDEPGSQVQLKMELSDINASVFLDQWIASAPEVTKWKLTIYRVHVDDTGSIVFWIGNVVSVRYENQGIDVIILCQSLNNLFTLQGPRKNWGTTCNHRLFGTDCTLVRGTFTTTTTVQSIDSTGLIYTLSAIPAPTVRWEGGFIIKPGTGLESRMIVERSGNDITLQYPIVEIGVGDTVQISQGCDHSITDCVSYSNVVNFGGTPYTPNNNPFTKRIDLPL